MYSQKLIYSTLVYLHIIKEYIYILQSVLAVRD